MYQNLQRRLTTCQNLSDLSPFIEMFFDTNQFKQQLSKLMQQQYQKEQVMITNPSNQTNLSSSNQIRSLYIQINSMQSIPSMDVQAHILSYLPSHDFVAIQVVSKHFNQILRQYAHVYNDNNYTLHISDFIGDNSKGWETVINHREAIIELERARDVKQTTREIPAPFNKIKRWKVYGDKHILNVLKNNARHIHSLDLNSLLPSVTGALSTVSASFDNCKILKAKHYIKCANMFRQLQYLDVSLSTEYVHTMLGYLPKSLQYLSLTVCNFNWNNKCEIIKIPSNVQWLRTCGGGVKCIAYDLSECDQLIGWTVTINIYDEVRIRKCLWPVGYIIPYVRINSSHGIHCRRQLFPARLVSFWDQRPMIGIDIIAMSLSEIQNRLDTFSDEEKLTHPDARWFVLKCTEDVWMNSIMEVLFADETERKKVIHDVCQMTKSGEGAWIKNMFMNW